MASLVSSVSRSVSEQSESMVCGYSGIEVSSHPVLSVIRVTVGGGGQQPPTLVIVPPRHRACHTHSWSTELLGKQSLDPHE